MVVHRHKHCGNPLVVSKTRILSASYVPHTGDQVRTLTVYGNQVKSLDATWVPYTVMILPCAGSDIKMHPQMSLED